MLKKIFDKFHLPFLVILAAGLNIINITNLGYGNTYYAAAIKSMLTSFSNFFFLSFDSTGFISVDKSPLSLWVDAIFAKIFTSLPVRQGFSGVSILIPHAIEGVIVTILVYLIVKKVTGKLPAFISALAITLSPVNVAVYRNNTPDALLLVFILLTILFLIKFLQESKYRFLLLSALMLGLGFNTKMLQAFLILPALIICILIFAKGNFLQRLKPLFIFLIPMLLVSFSWITIVDLTPVDQRPYVGGSTNNSAWDLAFNYNGIQRAEGENSVGGNSGFNVGEKGLTRLFTGEMGTQTGWLIVSSILFSIYFIIRNIKNLFLKFINKRKEISIYEALSFLSIVFFATGFMFFSYAGFFHSYYLNILAISIALITGALIYEVILSKGKNIFLILILFSNILMQIYLVTQANYAVFLIPVILVLGIVFLGLNFLQIRNLKFKYAFMGLAATLFIVPSVWSGYTTIQGNTATAIFIGGPSIQSSQSFGGTKDGGGRMDGNDGRDGRGLNTFLPSQTNGYFTMPDNTGIVSNPSTFQDGFMPTQGTNFANNPFGESQVSDSLLTYLKTNYNGEKYFVAVPSQSEAVGFILNENITNIMNLGGFSGRDQAITLLALQTKIANGEIRFFYLSSSRGGNNMDDRINRQNTTGAGGGSFNANLEITSWVTANCTAVSGISGLYDCKE